MGDTKPKSDHKSVFDLHILECLFRSVPRSLTDDPVVGFVLAHSFITIHISGPQCDTRFYWARPNKAQRRRRRPSHPSAVRACRPETCFMRAMSASEAIAHLFEKG